MKIRKATKKDSVAIRSLINAFPDKLMQDHLPKISAFFVAQENGKMLGCCALDIYSKRIAEVRSLAVSPAAQGKGIATLLIEACVKEAKKKKIYELLTITGAEKLFARHGFGAFQNEKFALLKVLGK